MGATLHIHEFDACSREKLANLVETTCDYEATADGVSYSGTWGSLTDRRLIVDQTLYPDENAAIASIHEKLQKSGPLRACRVLKAGEVADRRLRELQDRLARAEMEVLGGWDPVAQKAVDGFERKVLLRVREGKAKFRTCGQCKSKVAVAFLDQAHCPVCNLQRFIYSESDRRKLVRLEVRVKTLRAQVREHKRNLAAMIDRNPEAQKGWYWLVSALCPS